MPSWFQFLGRRPLFKKIFACIRIATWPVIIDKRYAVPCYDGICNFLTNSYSFMSWFYSLKLYSRKPFHYILVAKAVIKLNANTGLLAECRYIFYHLGQLSRTVRNLIFKSWSLVELLNSGLKTGLVQTNHSQAVTKPPCMTMCCLSNTLWYHLITAAIAELTRWLRNGPEERLNDIQVWVYSENL